MTDKLGLYNSALLVLGQNKLASLAEAGAARYALDDAYDAALRYCLEAGFWNFAMRTVLIDHDPSIEPSFGYQYAFEKPSDLIRVHSVSSDPNFNTLLLRYVEEAGYWYADVDPLYVRYVSNDVDYGMDLSGWPETFADYVSQYLAGKTCKRITGAYPNDDMKRDLKRALADARAKDAMAEPPAFPPRGTWVTSRGAGPANGTRRGLPG